MKDRINNITIFGAGKMGTGIGLLFAAKDFDVTLLAYDEAEVESAKQVVNENLNLLVTNEIITAAKKENALKRIFYTTNLEQAAKSADFGIECIVENLQLKQDYFKKLDELCDPDVILCTNTSAISITEIAMKAVHKERIIGTHFWNPPFLIPLVEVVRTVDIKDEVAEKTCDTLRRAGKKPIVVKKDVPGFIANRMQNALGREAVSIIENGIADPKDVDDAVKYSFGMRLGAIGPIEQIDSIGADLCLSISSYLYKYLENSSEPSPALAEKVEKGELGFKTGGVGFQTWSEEQMKEYNEGLVTNLIKVGKALNYF
jgi:3-hydroxyacyl-CoA dehydrogenase